MNDHLATRLPESSPSKVFISSGVSSKSKTLIFSSILEFVTDFGMGTVPIWIWNLKSINIDKYVKYYHSIYQVSYSDLSWRLIIFIRDGLCAIVIQECWFLFRGVMLSKRTICSYKNSVSFAKFTKFLLTQFYVAFNLEILQKLYVIVAILPPHLLKNRQ